ncbi:hypothetical protein OG286_01240 [Kitasatospora sp. NBC_00039]|uniref:baeRF2 domain-containing protein n=1 Tax=Kitasatospora sp. NPDC050467 TaxID=3364053 RepID=UPI0032560A92
MELAFLGQLLDRSGPWASVYLDTSRATEDAAKRQELFRRAIQDQLRGQGADGPTRAAVEEKLAAEPVSGAPPGRALFATAGEVVLDLPLGHAPAAPETTWSGLPHLAPLLTLRGDDAACLVARIDRTGADLELRDGGAAVPLGTAEGRQWQGRGHRSIPADRYEWHYRHRVQNTWEQTAQIIADELARCWPESGARLLVLAGDARDRHAVYRRLPDDLRSAAIEVEAGRRATGAIPEPLDDRITEAREARGHQHLDQVLDLFRTGRGGPGEHGPGGAETGPGPAVEAPGHRPASVRRSTSSKSRRSLRVARIGVPGASAAGRSRTCCALGRRSSARVMPVRRRCRGLRPRPGGGYGRYGPSGRAGGRVCRRRRRVRRRA